MLLGEVMGIIENYKNLFLHPRDFANDALDEGWPWWAYALIVIGWNLVSLIPFFLLSVFLADSIKAWGFVVLVAAAIILFPFFMIFVVNGPFKQKDMTFGEVYQVNLAYIAYATPLFLLFSILYMLSAAAILVSLTFAFALLIVGLVFMVATVWITISYLKILSELHNTSPWKIFGWSIIVSIMISVVYYGAMYAILENKVAKLEEKNTFSAEGVHIESERAYLLKNLAPSSSEEDIQAALELCKEFDSRNCPIAAARKILPDQYERALQICRDEAEGDFTKIRECYMQLAPAVLEKSNDVASTIYDFSIKCNQIALDDSSSDEDERCLSQFAIAVAGSNIEDAKQQALSVCNWIASSPNPDYSQYFSFRFECYKNTENLGAITPEQIKDFCNSRQRSTQCLYDASAMYLEQQKLNDAFLMCTKIEDSTMYFDESIFAQCHVSVWDQMEGEQILMTWNAPAILRRYDFLCMTKAAIKFAEEGKPDAIDLCLQIISRAGSCANVVAIYYLEQGNLDMAQQLCSRVEGEEKQACLQAIKNAEE